VYTPKQYFYPVSALSLSPATIFLILDNSTQSFYLKATVFEQPIRAFSLGARGEGRTWSKGNEEAR